MKKLTTVAVLAILTASSVSAEGFYVGAGISQEKAKPPVGDSLKSTNAIALIGYEVNDMISIEAETSLPVSKYNLNDSSSETTADFQYIIQQYLPNSLFQRLVLLSHLLVLV